MSGSRSNRQTAWVGALALVAAMFGAVAAISPANAASLSTSTLTIVVGGSGDVNVTDKSGSVSAKVQSGAPLSVKISQTTKGTTAKVTIKSSSKKTGGPWSVTLKDKNGTIGAIAVTVLPSMSATPASLSIEAGATGVITIANAIQLPTVSGCNTTYLTCTVTLTSLTVTGVSPSSELKLTLNDSVSKVTVKVTVTGGAVDFTSGRLLASNCFQCHGTDAKGGFDELNDKSAAEIYEDMKEFQADAAGNPNDIMAAHALGYTDEQLRALAAYIDTLG